MSQRASRRYYKLSYEIPGHAGVWQWQQPAGDHRRHRIRPPARCAHLGRRRRSPRRLRPATRAKTRPAHPVSSLSAPIAAPTAPARNMTPTSPKSFRLTRWIWSSSPAGCASLATHSSPHYPTVLNIHPALPGTFPGTHSIQRAYEAFQRGEISETGVMVHRVPDEGVDVGPRRPRAARAD